MAGTASVLVDTSALYAIISPVDLFHGTASAVYRRFADMNTEFWTTSYALVETVALLHRRMGFEVVTEFSDWRLESNVRILWVDDRMHDAAWQQFMAAQGRGLSFVDWTIVVASRQMDAPVFTFDGDFASEGLLVVPR